MARRRIVFMGTPEIAAVALRSLLADSRLDVVGVVAQPDRPKGRSMQRTPPPTKTVAQANDVPVLQPQKANDSAFLEAVRGLKPEVLVVLAYGQILRPRLLDMPPKGAVNIHTSLLPQYRGAAPIQWAIFNGDERTGVTLMQMDRGMDTGPILATKSTPILPSETGQSLHDRLAQLSVALLKSHLIPFLDGAITPRPQDPESATVAPKITKEDGVLDWRRSASEIDRQVRAFSPWPGTQTVVSWSNGQSIPIKIVQGEPGVGTASPGEAVIGGRRQILVGCGDGIYQIRRLQRPGRPVMSAEAFLAGHPLDEETRWGPTESS